MMNFGLEDLLLPIEINLAIALVIVEVIALLLVLVVFMFLRMRKYRPYYTAETNLSSYIHRYLTRIIDLTRKYARKISDDSAEGKSNATKRRQNMVARLNWLVLERDFIIEDKTDRMYWDDLNIRIGRMLKYWAEVEFIGSPPDAQIVEAALSEDPAEATRALRRNAADDGKDEIIKKLEERAHYLEKQTHKLASYKSLYFGMEKSYADLQKSYKTLKQTIRTLELEAGDKERLEKMLKEHENAEQTMESQLKEMEMTQQRLNAELLQLEDAFNKLEQEHRDQATAISPLISDADASKLGNVIKGDLGEGESLVAQEAIDKRDIMMRELKGAVLALNLDTDTKILIEEKINDLEKANEEVKTVLNLLEMERNRLAQEIETVKG